MAHEVPERSSREELRTSRRGVIGGDGLLNQPRGDDSHDFTRESDARTDPFLILFRRAHQQRRREIFVDDVVHDITHRHSQRHARREVHSQRRHNRHKSHVYRPHRIAHLFRIHRLGDDARLAQHQRLRRQLFRVRHAVSILVQLVVFRVRDVRRLDVSPYDHHGVPRGGVSRDSVRLHRRRERGEVPAEKAQEKSDDRRSELLRVVRLERVPRPAREGDGRGDVGLGHRREATRGDEGGRRLVQYRWKRRWDGRGGRGRRGRRRRRDRRRRGGLGRWFGRPGGSELAREDGHRAGGERRGVRRRGERERARERASERGLEESRCARLKTTD